MRVEKSRAGGTRRPGLGCAVALVTGLIVFLVVALISAAIFFLSPDHGSVSASFIHPQPGSVRWDVRERLNVLLLGVDTSHQASATDAMMIVSYDPHSSSISMVSIPGNLWVTIPGYGPGSISEAYVDGGIRLALLTVQSVTHVPIPYYAVAGFDAFRQIVDAFGGVTVHLPQPLSDDRYPADQGNGAISVRLTRGKQHLDGKTALEYVRIPGPDPGADVDRMQREQELLLALRQQALQPATLFHVPSIVNTLGGMISTNVPYDQLPYLAHSLMAVPLSHIHTAMLDFANQTVANYASGGTDVLLPDWQHIRTLAQQMFPDPRLHTGGPVEVLNGSGVAGQAAGLAAWLRQAQVRVAGYGSAGSFGYGHTLVIMNRAARYRADYIAYAVAALLQAPPVTGFVKTSKAPVVVIIGRDYQDPTQQ